MKKLVLMLFLILTLASCGVEKPGEQRFYYPRKDYTQNSNDSVISCEYRENQENETAIDFLNYYIQGPLDPLLVNPFPAELQVLDVRVLGSTVHVTVSDHLSSLMGTDTILACSSLGKTAAAFTGTSSAQIECQSANLNGKRYILIDEQSVKYLDAVPQETVAATTE